MLRLPEVVYRLLNELTRHRMEGKGWRRRCERLELIEPLELF